MVSLFFQSLALMNKHKMRIMNVDMDNVTQLQKAREEDVSIVYQIPAIIIVGSMISWYLSKKLIQPQSN